VQRARDACCKIDIATELGVENAVCEAWGVSEIEVNLEILPILDYSHFSFDGCNHIVKDRSEANNFVSWLSSNDDSVGTNL
jgi:hypothetical protein